MHYFVSLQPDMKLLLKIWLTQLRRDFKWGKFLGEAYFAFLFITLSIVITLVVREEVGDVTGMEKALPFIAVSMIIPDFIHKLLKNSFLIFYCVRIIKFIMKSLVHIKP